MFRRMLGTTPARYFTEAALGDLDRGARKLLQLGSDPGHQAEIVDFETAAQRQSKPR
jgi:hypothetical protein